MRHNKDDSRITIRTYERLGKKYIKDIAKVVPGERAGFIKLLPKGAKILDAGCAAGRDSKAFVKAGLKVVGIDLADIFLKEARKSVPKAKFIKMDVTKLKFPKNYFDGIWAHAVLMHVERKDVVKCLRGFKKILKPGGKIHILVRSGRKTVYKKDKLSQGIKRKFTYFLKDEFEKYVEKAGFKIILSKLSPDELKRKNIEWVTVWAKK